MTKKDQGGKYWARLASSGLDFVHVEPERASATRYTLSLEETALRFIEAGLPRNVRSLQRYCAAGRLDCIKEVTVSGLAYFVDPVSVERAITQLAQLHGITDEVRHGAPVHDMSHHVASEDQPRMLDDTPRPSAADRDNDTPKIQERQSPPQPDVSQYVARLESENVFLRDQIGVKDTQIAALLERDKETNFLIRGLQTILAPLLGTAEGCSTTTIMAKLLIEPDAGAGAVHTITLAEYN